MRTEVSSFSLSAVFAVALFTSGCASLQEDGGREFDAAWPDVPEMPKPTPGAIYAQGTENSLWQNVTARNVGDTLTIRLEESTNAEKTASTSTSKKTDASLTGPSILGRPITANGTPILEGSLGNESSFAGNGQS